MAWFLGIDLGSQGVRLVALDEAGNLVWDGAEALPAAALNSSARVHEQDADAWWAGVCRLTRALVEHLVARGPGVAALAGLAVDGTSGTVLPVAGDGRPLRWALMYNDARAGDQADRLDRDGDIRAYTARLGYRLRSSFALPKILWLRENEPDVFQASRYLVHQADYINGRFTGDFGRTDYSNALKTGFDLLGETWPEWLDRWPDVKQRLGTVSAPGSPIGQVTAAAAAEGGLPAGLPVYAGVTDGTAGFIASGARTPGDFNVTLGTTLVFKALSPRLVADPNGLVYSHKLPGGLWLPGAASNTGGEWIMRRFADADLRALDRAAEKLLPTRTVAYPLARQGERFPFLADQAEGFIAAVEPDPQLHYAACLQGTAFVERLGCEVLEGIMQTSGGAVYATGGGSRSDIWMQCCADACRRPVHRPALPVAAAGAAIVAAAGADGGHLADTMARMVRLEHTFVPDAAREAAYEEVYQAFRRELAQRGYL